ncbi:MAG: hypothetical protein GF405_05685 [Candidatus Eisenbacteria bacterium]|nr:hypothetical protein [Candidatus Eisenbacteria bacterium]
MVASPGFARHPERPARCRGKGGDALLPHALLIGLATAVLGLSPGAMDEADAPRSERSLSSVPAVAVDAPVARDRYVVGPGDRFLLSVLGDVTELHTLTVTPTGALTLPVGETVVVAGASIQDAEAVVRDVLSDYYHDARITLTLVGARQVIVHVTGAVENPGMLRLPATARVSAAIDSALGPLETASMRRIEVKGPDGRSQRADLVRFGALGELEMNPLVAAGAVIHIPHRASWVEVLGAVNAPGDYELVAGDDVSTLLAIAGGFAPGADTLHIELVRFDEDDPTEYQSFSLDLTELDRSAVPLRNGDRLFARWIEGWHREAHVEVIGEVEYPGVYSIREGTDRLSDLIERAGGFTERADLSRAAVLRRSAVARETAVERSIEFLSESDPASLGHTDYEFLRHGVVSRRGALSIDFRNVFVVGEGADDVLLRGGDFIDVPRRVDAVEVAGAVSRPGLVDYDPDHHYRDYIRAAGGFTNFADRGLAKIVRGETGQRERATVSVEIGPGDVIWVPPEIETEFVETLKDVLGILGQLATIYLVIDSVQDGN